MLFCYATDIEHEEEVRLKKNPGYTASKIVQARYEA